MMAMKFLVSYCFLMAMACCFRQVLGAAYDRDFVKGSWWCTTYENNFIRVSEQTIGFYDLARIHADGPTDSTLCNLYFVNSDIPYRLGIEWDIPWNTTGKTVSLTFFSRFSVFEPWRVIWQVQGGNSSGFRMRGEAVYFARLLLSNPDREPVSFHLTVRPPYGLPIDIQPWLWALIVVGAIIGLVVLVVAGAFIWKRCQLRNASSHRRPVSTVSTTTPQSVSLLAENNA